jgi:hypothetical protein
MREHGSVSTQFSQSRGLDGGTVEHGNLLVVGERLTVVL